MTIKNFIALACLGGLCLSPVSLAAPDGQDDCLASFSQHRSLRQNPLTGKLDWKNIGPTFCGGRVVDIEGYENHPDKFWAAAATGGLWLTEDRGRTWRGAFTSEATASIGDIAVSQRDENLVWLGSGESNAQSQSFPGCGVYKSTDGGKNWSHMGLAATRHIARIVIDPQNDAIVYVAAVGNLFAATADRGIYKTGDGGKTWQKVLFVSDKTGMIDLAMDPRNRNILYAAAWQKDRKPWNFSENGPESGIYKTHDGGRTWEKLDVGLPAGRNVGRIGLAVSRSNPSVVYAVLDNQDAKTTGLTSAAGKRSGMTVAGLEEMNAAGFLALADEQLALFLAENRAPDVFSPAVLKNFIRSGRLTPRLIAQMLFDANDRRLNPNTVGAEVYRSADAGGHWRMVNTEYIEDMYFTYGFYFGQIRVASDNENRVYILGVSAYVSADGGRTFKKFDAEQSPYANAQVHRDHHALWIDPHDPRRLVLGNDGGINVSENGGQSWSKVTNLSISQCYTVIADDERPANLYIGTQDNGVLVAPQALASREGPPSWHMMLGGDGAFIAPLPGDPRLLFAAAQFGALVRFEAGKNQPADIKPKSSQIAEPYRFNWLSPLLASRQRPGEILFGANKVLRSRDKGESWEEISPDLSAQRDVAGNTPYATITALAESELDPEILYAGTDDGNVWLRQGKEQRWERISQVLPGKCVSRIVASRYQAERVYLLMNGSKEDDSRPYLFVSENLGRDWEALRGNLPAEPLNVLAEDPDQENTLYLGSDRGLYASLDAGASWLSLQGNLPTVPVFDLFIHRRDKVMVAAPTAAVSLSCPWPRSGNAFPRRKTKTAARGSSVLRPACGIRIHPQARPCIPIFRWLSWLGGIRPEPARGR
jgi:photosystem II stability/assembly factor-like uncharacterized protein